MRIISQIVFVMLLAVSAQAEAVWQWSVPFGTGRAFLWIPETCRMVRGVVVGQNNMLEQGILEHRDMRQSLAKLCFAEVFISPPQETWQDAADNDAANARFSDLVTRLGTVSGYDEVSRAPVVAMGHSAMASFPWNFAAWNPDRTLAIVSVRGDAPLTHATGNSKPNADWQGRTIDGIPGVMVMGEYEWGEERIIPALAFRQKYPRAPVAMLAEPGSGHFNPSDRMVTFLSHFIADAASRRLPAHWDGKSAPRLAAIDPSKGWLLERWHVNRARTIAAAPFAAYTGDRREAFWAADKKMADEIMGFNADQIAKRPQLLGLLQDGKTIAQKETADQVRLQFSPLEDGLTFVLKGTFLDRVEEGSWNLPRWTGLAVGTPLGHSTHGDVRVSPITGPVVQMGANRFSVRFDRVLTTGDRRANSIWLMASHPGDETYKSIVQQALMPIPVFDQGREQTITFDPIADVRAGTVRIRLHAVSDSGRPVQFLVREGPAMIDGDELVFTTIPPRTKWPLSVTVVAWQLGQKAPQWKTAVPVTQTFHIVQ